MVHLKEIDTQRFMKGLKEEPQRSKDNFFRWASLFLGVTISFIYYLNIIYVKTEWQSFILGLINSNLI